MELEKPTVVQEVTQPSVFSIQKISKEFGHVKALGDVSFDIRSGEVVGLVGDNGAGKSTVVKILCGIYQPDSGSILKNNKEIVLNNPGQAVEAKIAAVFQDLRMINQGSIAHNVFLNREPRKFKFFVARKKMESLTEKILERVNIFLPSVRVKFESLSGGQRQAVAIARAISQDNDLLILDEPTAALGVKQTQEVHKIIREMRNLGRAVLLITHDLTTVLELTDRIIVLRQGGVWAVANSNEITNEQIIGWITGALHKNLGEQ